MMERPVYHAFYRPASCLRATGEDAFSFLQGQFSNDLRAPAPAATYGLWLNYKGRVLADGFALRTAADEFLLASYFSAAETVRERLEGFIIADDVTLEDQTSVWAAISIWGREAERALAATGLAAPAPGGLAGAEGGWIFRGRRSRLPSFECLLPREAEAAWRERVGEAVARLAGAEASEVGREAERIHSGIPAIPFDLGPGDLPNEGGLEESALSHQKGCYVGQEVMARIRSMGQVRRTLVRVKAERPPAALPAELYSGARKVGEWRTAAVAGNQAVGLALVARSALAESSGFALEPEGELRVSFQGEGPRG